VTDAHRVHIVHFYTAQTSYQLDFDVSCSFLPKDERQSVTGTEATVGDVRKDLVVLELTWSLETAAMTNHLSTWS